MTFRLPSPENRQSSPSSATALFSPSWNQTRSAGPRAGSQPSSREAAMSFRDDMINNAEKLYRRAVKIVDKMSLLQKILASTALVAVTVLGILFLVFNEKFFHFFEPYAQRWKALPGGWLILWALVFITGFPPLIGWSTLGTLAGFVYGVGEGWLIFATATVAGSVCSLIVSRTILRSYVDRLVANDKRFAALSLVLKHDGLKLLIMIRLCPLPYSISNGAMSTFPTVHPATYALATSMITPKLLIHVFIGSRLATIAKTGEKMSTATRAVNWLSIAIGVAVGLFTGIFIYRKTMARAAELEAQERQNRQQHHVPNSVPDPRAQADQFSDDPESQLTTEDLDHDDDEVDYFDDAPSPKPPYSDDLEAEEDMFAHGNRGHKDTISLTGQKK